MFQEIPITGTKAELSARIEFVDGLRTHFVTFLEDIGLTDDIIESWKLIFSEAVVNAIHHGSKDDSSKKVYVSWALCNDKVYLEVEDLGTGPSQKQIKNPALPQDPMSQNGRGLYIINELCDRWEHWTGPQGYRQCMARKHPEIINTPHHDTILESTLEELSQCYENLAAFHHLGQSLIKSKNVSKFIEEVIRDIDRVVPNDGIFLHFGNTLNESLLSDLKELDFYRESQNKDIPGMVFEEGTEFIWEKSTEIVPSSQFHAFDRGICCPIEASNETLGTLTLVRNREDRFLNASDLNTIRTFAELFGIAIAHENNSFLKGREQRALREIEIASEIQKTLLPVPEIIDNKNGWRLFAERKSAREVSGDYVDACIAEDGTLYLLTIDVMGKGISAAFLAAVLRTAMHIAIRTITDLEELINLLNETIRTQIGDLTIFATCSAAIIPPSFEKIHIVNAGHCPVLYFRKHSLFKEIEPSGPPLGLFDDVKYSIETFDLQPRDQILMVTDGLYEIESNGIMWGWKNLVKFFQTQDISRSKQLWNALQEHIDTYENHQETGDDQTLLYWEYTAKDIIH